MVVEYVIDAILESVQVPRSRRIRFTRQNQEDLDEQVDVLGGHDGCLPLLVSSRILNDELKLLTFSVAWAWTLDFNTPPLNTAWVAYG